MLERLNGIVEALGGVSMIKYVARRLLQAIPVMFTIIFMTFMLMRAMPSGPFDYVGTRSTPAAVKAALEARFGLDKPLLLNLPNDGIAPDNNIPTRMTYARAPFCDGLLAGQTSEEATPAESVYVYEGWALLRLVEEYSEAIIPINNKATRCITKRTVLYSDLTRSQFFQYFNNVLRLDFGLSMGRNTRNEPISELIAERFPVSARIGLFATIFGFLTGIPLGVIAALRRNSLFDHATTTFATIFNSIPVLVLGPILILLFNVQWKIFPTPDPRYWKEFHITDWDYVGRMALPMLTLGLGITAGIARLTRASVLQVLRDDYIRTARAKGLKEVGVIYIHALKNALIPVVTIIGPLLAGVLTGTLIIERVFGIPGMGSSFVDSITNRDYNLLVGVTIVYAIILIIGNILVDVTYTWLDPRIRFD